MSTIKSLRHFSIQVRDGIRTDVRSEPRFSSHTSGPTTVWFKIFTLMDTKSLPTPFRKSLVQCNSKLDLLQSNSLFFCHQHHHHCFGFSSTFVCFKKNLENLFPNSKLIIFVIFFLSYSCLSWNQTQHFSCSCFWNHHHHHFLIHHRPPWSWYACWASPANRFVDFRRFRQRLEQAALRRSLRAWACESQRLSNLCYILRFPRMDWLQSGSEPVHWRSWNGFPHCFVSRRFDTC